MVAPVVRAPVVEFVFYDESFARLWTLRSEDVPVAGTVVGHKGASYEVLGHRTNTTSAALGRPVCYVYVRRI